MLTFRTYIMKSSAKMNTRSLPRPGGGFSRYSPASCSATVKHPAKESSGGIGRTKTNLTEHRRQVVVLCNQPTQLERQLLQRTTCPDMRELTEDGFGLEHGSIWQRFK
jgi:hypothetical protein